MDKLLQDTPNEKSWLRLWMCDCMRVTASRPLPLAETAWPLRYASQDNHRRNNKSKLQNDTLYNSTKRLTSQPVSKILIATAPPINTPETTLPRRMQVTLAQLRTRKSSILLAYLNHINPQNIHHLCALPVNLTHTTHSTCSNVQKYSRPCLPLTYGTRGCRGSAQRMEKLPTGSIRRCLELHHYTVIMLAKRKGKLEPRMLRTLYLVSWRAQKIFRYSDDIAIYLLLVCYLDYIYCN